MINHLLSKDRHCRHLIPVNIHSNDIYTRFSDGIAFCKLLLLIDSDSIEN